MNNDWSVLNQHQLGRYAEYYSKMEFASYGFDVYTSEVDDHGVDFVAKNKAGAYLEVQVKSICKTNYMFIKKDKIETDDSHIVVLIRFEDFEEPEMYVFPASVWNNPNPVFRDREYDEWGFNYSNKNRNLIEQFYSEKYLPMLAGRN